MQTSNNSQNMGRPPVPMPSSVIGPASPPDAGGEKIAEGHAKATALETEKFESEKVQADGDAELARAAASAADPAPAVTPQPESQAGAQLADRQEMLLDLAIELTFPASDPIAITPAGQSASTPTPLEMD